MMGEFTSINIRGLRNPPKSKPEKVDVRVSVKEGWNTSCRKLIPV